MIQWFFGATSLFSFLDRLLAYRRGSDGARLALIVRRPAAVLVAGVVSGASLEAMSWTMYGCRDPTVCRDALYVPTTY